MDIKTAAESLAVLIGAGFFCVIIFCGIIISELKGIKESLDKKNKEE